MTDEEKRPDTADSDSKAEAAAQAEPAADSKADTERGASSEEQAKASEPAAAETNDISEEETVTANVAAIAASHEDHGDAGHGDAGHGDAGHGDAGHGDAGHGDAGHGDAGHGHGGHGHDDHDEHLGHTAPMSLLYGVLGALILLTVLTVGVTAVDLGGQGNFIVAMVIATVKAVLVMGYFMHMIWDNKFNVLAFTSSFLFVLLFLAMTVLDRGEYKDTVKEYENDHPAAAVAK